ncbi:MAG: ABC transporter permease, partial [Myxococcota bacterium]
MAAPDQHGSSLHVLESLGRGAFRFVDAFGFGAHLFFESLYWLIRGRRMGQRVRAEPVFAQMMV